MIPGPVSLSGVSRLYPTGKPKAERMAVRVVSAMLMMTLQVFFFSGVISGQGFIGYRFQVSGFKFQVSSFRFQVSSFRFQVSGFRFQVKVKVKVKVDYQLRLMMLA